MHHRGGDRDLGVAGVLIVDDQPALRAALHDLVSATPGLTLIGEADSGEEALEAVAALAPRMVIMDKRMPGIGGIEATQRITTQHPHIVVLLVSVERPEPELVRGCGAAAFLAKQHLSARALTEVWRTHGERATEPADRQRNHRSSADAPRDLRSFSD